ncbi:MAG: hypothetical protein NTW74_25330 [Acidobacteria bacterium]|nr:hypothetical protein [Acidobacteriota bacterium]
MKKALMTLLISSSATIVAGEYKSFFSVPFAIQINGETLPSGQYKVIAKSSALDQLRIVNIESGLSVLLNSNRISLRGESLRHRSKKQFAARQGAARQLSSRS